MEPRPKIKPEISQLDKILEVAGWLSLSLIWIITLLHYKNLPETIPVHFNVAGQADGFGDKTSIFFLPVLGTVLFIGMSILNLYPQIFNYPVKITEENAMKQYAMATRLIRVLKLSVIITFILIVWLTGSTAVNQSGNTGIWLLPVILGITFIPLAYYLLKSFKEK